MHTLAYGCGSVGEAADGSSSTSSWPQTSSNHSQTQEFEGAAAAAPPLRRLELSYTRVSDVGMTHLAAALPHLRWLGLKGCNVGDDGLIHLLQLQQLTALHIKHCHRWAAGAWRCESAVLLHRSKPTDAASCLPQL